MKQLKTYILLFILLLTPMSQTRSAVAALWAIWNPATATSIAMYGLASPFVGRIVFPLLVKQPGNREAGWILGIVLGVVILDDDGIPNLGELSKSQAGNLEISEKSREIFNSEIEEVNQVLQEVSMQILENTTYDEARSMWNEFEGVISPESFEVIKAIADNAAKEVL